MYLKSQKKKRMTLNIYLERYWMKFSKNNEKKQITDPKRQKTPNTLIRCRKKMMNFIHS